MTDIVRVLRDLLRRGRPAWAVFLLATAAFTALQVAHNRHLFAEPIYEGGDFAANSLLVIKAKRELVLHGHYSRMGFYHPGPSLIYVLAASEWILHDLLGAVPAPHNAHILGHMLLHAALLGVALAMITRAGGRAAGAAAGLAFLIYLAREGQLAGVWWAPGHWFAYTFFFVYLPFQVAAASVAAGRTGHLGWLALTAGLAVHSHVSFVLFVVPITLYALCALARGGRRWGCLPARVRRSWYLFGCVAGLFALPILLHAALHFPGEVGRYVRQSAAPRPAAGTTSGAVRFLARTLTNDSELGWPLAAAVGAAAVAAALTFPPRGRRFARQLVWVGLLTTGAMSFYARRGVDNYQYIYLGFFYASVMLLMLTLIAMRAVALCRAWPLRTAFASAGVAAAGWAAQTGHFTNTYPGVPDASSVAAEISADPRWRDGPPVMTIGPSVAWVDAGALLVQLQRRGCRPWLSDPAWHIQFTDAFQPDPAVPGGAWRLSVSASSPATPPRRDWGPCGDSRVREPDSRWSLGVVPLEELTLLEGWRFGGDGSLVATRDRAALLLNSMTCPAQRAMMLVRAEGQAPGKTAAGQRVRIAVNGRDVGELVFPSGEETEQSLTFDAAVLAADQPVRVDVQLPDAHRYKRAPGSAPEDVFSIRITRLAITAAGP